MSTTTEILEAVVRAGRLSFLESIEKEEKTGTEIIACEALLPEWTPGAHILGEACQYGEQAWRCCQAHDSRVNREILPGEAPAHWAAYHTKDPRRAKPYITVTGAHDVYNEGECILWTDGAIYRAKRDAIDRDPEILPQAWERVSE